MDLKQLPLNIKVFDFEFTSSPRLVFLSSSGTAFVFLHFFVSSSSSAFSRLSPPLPLSSFTSVSRLPPHLPLSYLPRPLVFRLSFLSSSSTSSCRLSHFFTSLLFHLSSSPLLVPPCPPPGNFLFLLHSYYTSLACVLRRSLFTPASLLRFRLALFSLVCIASTPLY